MRTTPTAEDDFAATQLECLNRHHLLEIVLDVVEKVVFVFKPLTIRAETPGIISVVG